MKQMMEIIGYDNEVTMVIEYFPTSSPHFVITPQMWMEKQLPGWNLTHYESTCKVIGPFKTKEEVRLMAAIFDALPMKWAAYSTKVAQKPESKQAKQFKESWLKIPEEIRKWRHSVSQDCESYFADIRPEDPHTRDYAAET